MTPALLAGGMVSGAALADATLADATLADATLFVSPRVTHLVTGLFCAPTEGTRRAAPDTIAGWVHVPDAPVAMVAEGQVAATVIGLGFGVRYTLADTRDAQVRYLVTHPPIPPAGTTRQSWQGVVRAGYDDTLFFQFDVADELQPGDWRFRAAIDDETLFEVGFTVFPAAEAPDLAGLCVGDDLLSLSQKPRAAAG